MRLLIIGPDMQSLDKVKNFTGVQAYYLARELRRRGVELIFIDGKHKDPLQQIASIEQDADHVLALGLRWFTHKPPGLAQLLKATVKGAVTQIHDGLVHESLAPHMAGVDCTFTFRDDSTRTRGWERYAKNNCYIGWAADPELLYPEQSPTEFRVLIDHPYYKGGIPDHTAAITADVMAFARGGDWRKHWQSVHVRRLVNGGAEDVYQNDPMVRSFDRKHIPFTQIADEYRKANVYVVTHKESVGLTCLETACCGALTLTTRGLIYDDRLATIRHFLYDGTQAPWPQVLREINIKASAEMARSQSWDKVADRMLRWFSDY